MTAEHFDHVILTLLDRRPFSPFTVELNSGERFGINHPHATVIRDGSAVDLKPGGGFMAFDHESVNRVINDLADSQESELG